MRRFNMNLVVLEKTPPEFGKPLRFALWSDEGALLAHKGYVLASKTTSTYS